MYKRQLWFFAEQPSDWIALIYQLRQEFPDMTFIKQPIAVDSTVSDTLATQRSGQIFGIAVGSTLAALALTLHEVRRQKKQTPAASALNILGRSCGTVSYTHLDVYKRQALMRW